MVKLKLVDCFSEIKTKDLLLTIDRDNNQEVCRVTCADMPHIWTRGTEVGHIEICETYEEMKEGYRAIYRIVSE